MKTVLKKICLGLALMGIMALLGCATNTVVPLNYALVTPAGQSCKGPVTVLEFKDARKQHSLGRDSDGYELRPATDVGDWVSWSLYEELVAQGCSVKYRGVRRDEPVGTLVSGEVVDVRLTPMGKTVWKGMVKVAVSVERNGVSIPKETFISEVEKPIIFGVSNREEVLTEALQGVMEQVVPKVLGKK